MTTRARVHTIADVHRTRGWMLAALCLAGCGARSELHASAGVGGSSSSTSTDTTPVSGAGGSSTAADAGGMSSSSSGAGGSTSSSSGAGAGSCTWTFGEIASFNTGDYATGRSPDDVVDDEGRIVVTNHTYNTTHTWL